MKEVLFLFLFFFFFCQPCAAETDYESGRHIWIWQEEQLGEAVEDGQVVYTFRIISGRSDRMSTREGDFRIFQKSAQHAAKNGTPMPYSMFFDGRRALHGWSWTEPFPTDEESPWVASHGCVSTEIPEELFYWAPMGTPVHVRGHRTGYW